MFPQIAFSLNIICTTCGYQSWYIFVKFKITAGVVIWRTMFSVYSKSRNEVNLIIKISICYKHEKTWTFLDTKVFKGARFHKESILDVQTYYKPTENFQYTNFYSCHPPGITKLKTFYQGRSIKAFTENMKNFEKRLLNRGCLTSVVEKHLSEVKFSDRKSSLKQKMRDALQ